MALEKVAVGYAEGVLKSALGKLGSFLYSETLLWCNFRQDLQFIKDELQSMDAFMQDVLRSGPQNEQMKIWMIQVFEVACESEECISKFTKLLEGDPNEHKSTKMLKKPFRFAATVIPRYEIVTRIQKLKNRAKEVSERRFRYSTTATTKGTGVTEFEGAEEADSCLIRYNHLIGENKLVGIDTKEQEKLFDGAFQADKNGKTILWICGAAGSGKTALAKMIYRRRNQPNYKICCSAWVTASKEFDYKRVLNDILRQVAEAEGDTEENLEAQLRSALTQKMQQDSTGRWRFLLILDAFERTDCDHIIKALPREQDGYRLVVTTRVAGDEHTTNIPSEENFEENTYKVKELTWGQRSELVNKLLSNDSSLNRSSFVDSGSWHMGNKIIKYWPADNFKEVWNYLIILLKGMERVLQESGGEAGRLVVQIVSSLVRGVTFATWKAISLTVLVLMWHQVIDLVFSLRDAILLIMNWRTAFWCIFLIFFGQAAIQYHLSMLLEILLAAIQSNKTFSNVRRFLINPLNLFIFQLQMVSQWSNPVALKCLCAVIASPSMNSHKLMELFFESIKLLMHPYDNRILEMMTFCCNRMSISSRKCLKDLNDLPEGYVIERKKLIGRWLAQDLVNPSGWFSKEEEAERCFNELVSCSVIEPESVSPSGQIKSCRVNGAFKEVISMICTSSHRPGDENSGDSQEEQNQQNTEPVLTLYPFNIRAATAKEDIGRCLKNQNQNSLTIIDLKVADMLAKSKSSTIIYVSALS